MKIARPAGGLALVCLFLLAYAAVAAAAAPTFNNYAGPTDQVGDAGEPSIGYNPKTDKVFFQAATTTSRVDFSKSPPTWTDVTEPTALLTLDPILFTDRQTSRTFSSQLLLACSKMSFTDDDGETWTPSQGCGVGTLFDHQTVGGGPFSKSGPGPTSTYPNAVYYCAQASDINLSARCALSRDGGQTFGVGVQIYPQSQCPYGLHGHLKVDPSGTAYVPVFDCDGKQAVTFTKDNGRTWTVDEIPGSTTQDESDPHLGIGKSGTLYFGFQGANGQDLGDKGYLGHAFSEGHALISVKPAGSSQWNPPVDVGAALGVKNIQFPEVYAGDDDRAAFAFLGTTTAGDDQDKDFKGVWHLYVAYTYDRGATWTTVDATPNDPVQRGCIWLQGGSSDCRNLLDFNDITIDNQGRVLVAYADGCTGKCATDPTDYADKDALGTIARQESGLGLFSANDPAGTTSSSLVGTPAPAEPSNRTTRTRHPVCAARGSRLVHLPRKIERWRHVRATVRGKRVHIRALRRHGRRPSVRVRFKGHPKQTLKVTGRKPNHHRGRIVRHVRACR